TVRPQPALIALVARRARHEFDGRGSRVRRQHAVENASGVSAVLGPIGRVNFVVDCALGVDECDVVLNAAGSYSTLVPLPGIPEPMSTFPPDGANVQVVAVTDDPHGHRLSRRVIAPEWRVLHFFRCSNLGELI